MSRNHRSAQKAGVACNSCGRTRYLKHPELAGEMCRACAQKIAVLAAAAVNASPTMDKFEAYVQRTDYCWNWGGYRYGNGYAAITDGGRQVLAHRWAYEAFRGPIPEGMTIDHLCRNRACVNPDHLEPVTSRENTRRAMRLSCINGHRFTPENTYMHKGKRYCRTCRRDRNTERRLANVAKP